MPIPTKMNPMGRSNQKKYFELIVQPGILATTMTYGFTPFWNTGGYCSVDWGDGQKEDATKSGTALNHTYTASGTYTIKIKADCYLVQFATTGKTLISDCSETLDFLGDLTSGSNMFYNCSNATLPLTSLPESLTSGNYMFRNCTNAQLPLTKLPDSLTNGNNMFTGCSNATLPLTSLPEGLTNGTYMFLRCHNAQLRITKLPDGLTSGLNMFPYCYQAEIDLDELVANAPADGWTALTNISYMFSASPKVTGSRSAFLAKCPANVTGADTAFSGTNTTE